MRVLQLHSAYRQRSGEERVIDNERDVLVRAGHEVEQLIVSNPSSIGPTLTGLAQVLHNRSSTTHVARVVRDFRPDVVHAHNTWFALTAASLATVADLDVPLVRTMHNHRYACISADMFRDEQVCTRCASGSPLPGVVHGCYRGSRLLSTVAAVELMASRRRGLFALPDVVIAPTEFLAARLVEGGLDSERIRVKPHFTLDPGPRPQLPSSSDEILFVGRLAPGKGLPALLRAWQRVGPVDGRQLRLTIIGDGPLRSELHEAAPPGVELTGQVRACEVQQRLLRARAVVFPSTWLEPFGMVLLEAMAAGLPVVTTCVGAAQQIVGGPERLRAAPDDAASLAAALSQLDDTTVDVEGAAARQRYDATYTPDRGLEDLVAVYEEAIERHAAARGGRRRPSASAVATPSTHETQSER